MTSYSIHCHSSSQSPACCVAALRPSATPGRLHGIPGYRQPIFYLLPYGVVNRDNDDCCLEALSITGESSFHINYSNYVTPTRTKTGRVGGWGGGAENDGHEIAGHEIARHKLSQWTQLLHSDSKLLL